MSVVFDLFCGAGGASTGLVQAAASIERPITEMVAVNHWAKAVETHRRNHPWATVLQEDVSRVDPRPLLGGKKVKVGLAGPSCVHFTQASGGMPLNDQERSHAWDVARWARLVEPENLIIENVPAFETWGPLRQKRDKKTGELVFVKKTGQPHMEPEPARKREYFNEFIATLKRLGYNVDYRVLCAAHYGDATSRRRLFVQARRGRITWPEPTYRLPCEQADLFDLPTARTARDIIDFYLPLESIWTRKKPLSPNTMERIIEGLKRYVGGPFIVPQLACARPRSLDEPLNTIMGSGTGNALVQPFLLGIGGPRGRQVPSSLDHPLATVISQNHTYLVEPFLLRYNDGGRVQGLSEPITTIDGSNRFALIQPFLVSYYGTGHAHSLDDALPTITGKDRFALIEAIGQALDKGITVVWDIRMRMLQAHELAAAHSFPADYQLLGSNKDRVKMVGNSWPVATAQALCREVLS